MVGSVGQSHHKMCSGHLKFNLATQNIGVCESTKQVISRGRLHLHRGEIASSPRVQEGSPWVLPCFTGPQAKGGTLCTVEPYKWFAKLNWDGHYARWDFHQWRLERGASQAEEPKDHCFRTRDLQDIPAALGIDQLGGRVECRILTTSAAWVGPFLFAWCQPIFRSNSLQLDNLLGLCLPRLEDHAIEAWISGFLCMFLGPVPRFSISLDGT